jgi:glyoxylase-like metal-dependent hydrolase (beta-lactamase superfamily II)
VTEDVIAREIDVQGLQDWLDGGTPATVLDVRTDDDRAQWSIPGSRHVDAYDALRGGLAGPLADLDLPPDRPVVTVCNAGRMSQAAADVLTARGFAARSLTGGMKAWSTAWNVAELTLGSVHVMQVRRTGKGCLSYIVASHGHAAVIDASVAPAVYAGIAERYGWSIRHVLDTHIHADHLSRSRELARLADATLWLPRQDRVGFAHRSLRNLDGIRVGDATLVARHTPGHTQESMSYLLNDAALFTGDTLFTNGVGRPDLHADPAAARDRARSLFVSLGQLRQLGAEVLVLPGHSSEPIAFDGQPVAARMGEVSHWLAGWLTSESAFVDRVTSHLPPTPANFVQIVALNEAGELRETDQTETLLRMPGRMKSG